MKNIKWLDTLWVLYLTNAREFLRDRMTLFLVVLLPVALAVFFGLIFGGTDSFTLQTGLVIAGDGNAVAEQMIADLARRI